MAKPKAVARTSVMQNLPRVDAKTALIGGAIAGAAYVAWKLWADWHSENSLQLAAIAKANEDQGIVVGPATAGLSTILTQIRGIL